MNTREYHDLSIIRYKIYEKVYIVNKFLYQLCIAHGRVNVFSPGCLVLNIKGAENGKACVFFCSKQFFVGLKSFTYYYYYYYQGKNSSSNAL